MDNTILKNTILKSHSELDFAAAFLKDLSYTIGLLSELMMEEPDTNIAFVALLNTVNRDLTEQENCIERECKKLFDIAKSLKANGY